MKKIIIRIIGVILGLGILGGIFGTVTLIYFSFGLPKISTLADYRPAIPSRILAKDGTVLAEIAKERRRVIAMNDIPKRIVDAFLSAEDSSFYDHSGVDYLGVIRAAIANLKAGRVVQGGSTITQQVAKSLLLTSERSISRKIKDFLLAQKIEEKFSKEEILYLYLNQVYLGGGYYGVQSAFEGYFGKTLEEASIAESAIVAGLLVAPGRYSPYINPKRAKARQEYVLKRMYSNGKISEKEYKDALNEKIKFRLRKSHAFKAGYFTDWVRQRVIDVIGEEKFLIDGYTIQTTLDWNLQQVAEKEVAKGVKAIDKRQGFKGPLKELEEDNWLDFFKNSRAEFYKDNSQFFTITEDYKRDYELKLNEEVFEKIKTYEEDFRKDIKSRRFISGYLSEDPFVAQIKPDSIHKAVVEKVDNEARIVYCSINGVRTIIPYAGFRWAHERSISDKRNFYPYVTRPTTILKKGDVIQVEVKKTSVPLMRYAYSSFKPRYEKLKTLEKRRLKKERYVLAHLDQEADAQGALVSMDPKTGEVVSFVGGADFAKSQFNRAIQSRRQPGSAFKPILFAAALENGFTPATIIIDSPETLGGVDETLNWKPRNYDGKFKGPVTVRNSLEQSRNVTTIKMAHQMGVSTILDFTERIGFNAKLDQDLSLALGSFGVTLMDIVSTYAIFPNGGKRIIPKTIVSVVDRFGTAIPVEKFETFEEDEVEEEIKTEPTITSPEVANEEGEKVNEDLVEEALGEEKKQNPFHLALNEDQVYDPRLAYLMTNLLRGVVLHGTGQSAKSVSTFLGGKTGTTNNYVDAWFLGFSSNLVTGVWTGFDENETLGWGETGAKSALPIWREFMRAGIKKYGEYDFKTPGGIVNVLINKKSGKAVSGGEGQFMESFVEGTEPGAEERILGDNTDIKIPEENTAYEDDDYYSSQ